MSLGRIIISISACIGVLLFQKTKPRFLQIMLIGFIISFILSFFEQKIFFQFSFISFGALIIAFFIYSIYYKNWLPTFISAFALISFIFMSQNWPYGSEIQASMLIPIILFFIVILNFKKFVNQFSILAIIAAYEIYQFINLFC